MTDIQNTDLPDDRRRQYLEDFIAGAARMGVEVDARYIQENFTDRNNNLWHQFHPDNLYGNALKIRVFKNVRWVAQNLSTIKHLMHIDCSRTLPPNTRYTLVTDRMEFGKAWGIGWVYAPHYLRDKLPWPQDETYIFPGSFNEETGTYLLGRYLV